MSLQNGHACARISGVGTSGLAAAAASDLGVEPVTVWGDSLPSGCVVLLRNPLDRYASLQSALGLSDDEVLAGIRGEDARYQTFLAPYSQQCVGINLQYFRRDQIAAAAQALGLQAASVIEWPYDSAVASPALQESLTSLVADDFALWSSLS